MNEKRKEERDKALQEYYKMQLEQNSGCAAPTWAFLMLLILLLVGCKTVEYVDRPVTHTEYIYKDRVDSVNIHDSVYIKELVKGDTVRIVEYRYRDRFQYISVLDTVSVRDTVSVVVEKVVVQTEHKLLGWQKGLIWWGVILTFALIVIMIFLRKNPLF